MNQETLGVDIGGVIIDQLSPTLKGTFFSDDESYLMAPMVYGSFEALGFLAATHFAGRVYLVSACGERTRRKNEHWLEKHNFFTLTGIRQDSVHFCRERYEKARICRELGITHFVDDRLEVLSGLGTVAVRYLFNPDLDEIQRFSSTLRFVKQVKSWSEILRERYRHRCLSD